jgi:hypothetical protein
VAEEGGGVEKPRGAILQGSSRAAHRGESHDEHAVLGMGRHIEVHGVCATVYRSSVAHDALHASYCSTSAYFNDMFTKRCEQLAPFWDKHMQMIHGDCISHDDTCVHPAHTREWLSCLRVRFKTAKLGVMHGEATEHSVLYAMNQDGQVASFRLQSTGGTVHLDELAAGLATRYQMHGAEVQCARA